MAACKAQRSGEVVHEHPHNLRFLLGDPPTTRKPSSAHSHVSAEPNAPTAEDKALARAPSHGGHWQPMDEHHAAFPQFHSSNPHGQQRRTGR